MMFYAVFISLRATKSKSLLVVNLAMVYCDLIVELPKSNDGKLVAFKQVIKACVLSQFLTKLMILLAKVL